MAGEPDFSGLGPGPAGQQVAAFHDPLSPRPCGRLGGERVFFKFPTQGFEATHDPIPGALRAGGPDPSVAVLGAKVDQVGVSPFAVHRDGMDRGHLVVFATGNQAKEKKRKDAHHGRPPEGRP